MSGKIPKRIPKRVETHRHYAILPDLCKKLLRDMLDTSPLKFNGLLMAEHSYLKDQGWQSQEVIDVALKSLIQHGLLVECRKADEGFPATYATTFWKVCELARHPEFPDYAGPYRKFTPGEKAFRSPPSVPHVTGEELVELSSDSESLDQCIGELEAVYAD